MKKPPDPRTPWQIVADRLRDPACKLTPTQAAIAYSIASRLHRCKRCPDCGHRPYSWTMSYRDIGVGARCSRKTVERNLAALTEGERPLFIIESAGPAVQKDGKRMRRCFRYELIRNVIAFSSGREKREAEIESEERRIRSSLPDPSESGELRESALKASRLEKRRNRLRERGALTREIDAEITAELAEIGRSPGRKAVEAAYRKRRQRGAQRFESEIPSA